MGAEVEVCVVDQMGGAKGLGEVTRSNADKQHGHDQRPRWSDRELIAQGADERSNRHYPVWEW